MKIRPTDLIALIEAYAARHGVCVKTAWDEAQTAQLEAEAIRAENERLRQELVRVRALVQREGVGAEADTELGRLVRAMPHGWQLIHHRAGTAWSVSPINHDNPKFGHTPEIALRTAGVGQEPAQDADTSQKRPQGQSGA